MKSIEKVIKETTEENQGQTKTQNKIKTFNLN